MLPKTRALLLLLFHESFITASYLRGRLDIVNPPLKTDVFSPEGSMSMKFGRTAVHSLVSHTLLPSEPSLYVVSVYSHAYARLMWIEFKHQSPGISPACIIRSSLRDPEFFLANWNLYLSVFIRSMGFWSYLLILTSKDGMDVGSFSNIHIEYAI